MSEILNQTKAKMTAALEHFQTELKGLRTNRANPAMLDPVTVDVWGSKMRIKDVASITTPEMRMILITPFDAQSAGAIGKAIEKANLGFQPIVDGNAVRLIIPQMDAAMRKKMVELCHRLKEAAKISVRNIRRDANELAKRKKSEGVLAEDALKRAEKEIQKSTDDFCKKIDEAAEKKEKEISTI